MAAIVGSGHAVTVTQDANRKEAIMDVKTDIPDAELLNLSDLSAGGDLDDPRGVLKEALVRISLAADSIHKQGVMRQFRAVL
jgi:hypothetical protein